MQPTSSPQPAIGAKAAALLMIGAGALATAGEIVIAILLHHHLATLPYLIAAHALLSLLLLLTAAWLYRKRVRSPAFLLLVIATPMMGPFGAVGAASAAVLRYLFSLRAIPFEQWYASLVPNLETTPARQLYERLVMRRGEPASRSTVASFRDVMALGTAQQKQIVLTAIADQFRPEFAPALKSALSDVEPAVRVQAASVSARIESAYLSRSVQLEEDRQAEPDNPTILLSLAEHYDAWAATELLDPARARTERMRALDYYRRLDAIRPGEHRILDAIGRLLLALDRPDQALVYLRTGAAREDAPPQILALHLECLFRLGRMSDLRRTARACWATIAGSALPDDMREAVRAWAGDAPEIVAA